MFKMYSTPKHLNTYRLSRSNVFNLKRLVFVVFIASHKERFVRPGMRTTVILMLSDNSFYDIGQF